jgi:hypothetical protein
MAKVAGVKGNAVAAAVAAAREAARAAGEKIGPAVSRAAREANGSLPVAVEIPPTAPEDQPAEVEAGLDLFA